MSTKQEYINNFISLCEEGTLLVSDYINAKEKITLSCKHGHLRSATSNSIVSRGNSTYCKVCDLNSKFERIGVIQVGEYLGANYKMLVRKISCGHEYEATPANLFRGRTTCPICHPSRRSGYSADDFSKEILTKYSLVAVGPFINFKTNVLVQNTLCKHIYEVNPGHLLYEDMGSKCKVCSELGGIKHRLFTKLLESNFELLEEYTGSQTPVLIKNNVCGHSYKVTPNNYVSAGSGEVCRVCNPDTAVSKGEIEIYEFISSIYPGWIVQSDRLALQGKELDLIIPDKAIAIEYNGTYWHSEDKLGPLYHLDKTNKVAEFDFSLIHIFDYEWLEKQEIVKSRLRSLLGNTTKIYARHTEVREIPFPSIFLETNHLQGKSNVSKFNYGLFLKEELIAVMTFGIPRFTKEYDYELIRYCCKLNTTVVGGASKLLKYFRSKHAGSIISYADRRWSTGNLYAKLGFSFKHNSAPGYKYYKGKKVLSRYQCQKHLLKTLFPELWEEAKSETAIMSEAGYNKVFDCGNSVWVLK